MSARKYYQIVFFEEDMDELKREELFEVEYDDYKKVVEKSGIENDVVKANEVEKLVEDLANNNIVEWDKINQEEKEDEDWGEFQSWTPPISKINEDLIIL